MNILKNIFLFKKNAENNKDLSHKVVDQYIEIAKLVKEARIQQNLTIQELSLISKIPEQTINSIENNIKKNCKSCNLGCILKFEGFYRHSRCRSVALNVPTDQESRRLCNNKVYYCITGALAFF